MKSVLLLIAVWSVGALASAQSGSATPPAQPKGKLAFANKSIGTYQEILDALPSELRSSKSSKWTQVQREAANTRLKEAFVPHVARAHMRLKVTEIANWGGMTFYSEVTKVDGCYIRVFGKFPDTAKAKLATLKKGDYALLDGAVTSISYCQLWNTFTLSICLEDCTFEK